MKTRSRKSNSTEQRHYNAEEDCRTDHTKMKLLARAIEQQSETTNTSFDENKI